MSGRLALRELHGHLELQASEGRQFKPNALGLLLEPRAQRRLNADHDLVRYSLFHRSPLRLTCKESNPAGNTIERHFRAVAFSGTVLFQHMILNLRVLIARALI